MTELTVFTPTFNRRSLLPRLYQSLVMQTDKNFIWLIIDDGSLDGTNELVHEWQGANEINIQYIYQKNMGMSGAHNTAYENIFTVWNVCIDSDDMLPQNGVEIINSEIQKINTVDIGAIVGLDSDFQGNILGNPFPEISCKVKINAFMKKHSIRGDKKFIFRTALMQNIEPYPIFFQEKLVPLSHKYILAEEISYCKVINKVLCHVEYQEDGSTKNMLKQYRRNPRGFAYARITRINLEKHYKDKLQNAVHLVSSVLFTGEYSSLFRTQHTGLVLLAVPVGVLLHLYIRLKTQKDK